MIGAVRFGDPDSAVFDLQQVVAAGRLDADGPVHRQVVGAIDLSVHGDCHRIAALLQALQQRKTAQSQQEQGDGQQDICFFEKGSFMTHRSLKKFIAALLLTALIVSQCACTAQTAPEEQGAQTSFGEDWLLNTYCYIQTYEGEQENLIRQAFSVARNFENQLSRTIQTSDIGQFNASQSGCTVDVDTALLLQDARDAWEWSDHMLDVTMGAVTQLWNFSAEEPTVPDAAAIEEALAHVGSWEQVGIEPVNVQDPGDWQVSKADPAIAFDLGAIAKGYIADRVADFLRQHDVARAVVNFGGNVVFVGSKEDGSPWACGIEDPAAGGSEALIQDRDLVGLVRCGEGSVVTSGTYERCFEQDGVLYHHVLDPRTGYPVETDLLSATIIGPSSQVCDTLSTSCLLLGSEKGMALVDSFEDYEAVFILEDGSIMKTFGADFQNNEE